MEIYETNDSFDFSKLVLTKPSLIAGGNYFSRCLVNNGPLYIQPPKCKTKQGFTKAGKKFFCDLMFTNEDENFIRWMENLENHCQEYIYKNREKWFDGQLELHDIENYFTSPLKLFKSGKYYITRVNVNTVLSKPALKIYDENENEVKIESINDTSNIVTIIEIQGIKCSSRSFQIEIDLKQIMVLQPTNLFEKCIIKSSSNSSITLPSSNYVTETDEPLNENTVIDNKNIIESLENIETDLIEDTVVEDTVVEDKGFEDTVVEESHVNNDNIITEIIHVSEDGLQEIDFDLEELNESEPIQIKKRNDVYYEMYREARKKAKVAKDLALSAYLEAKRIKNAYMLNDIEDSDDSDLETEDDEEED
jgi:hypothetical protein